MLAGRRLTLRSVVLAGGATVIALTGGAVVDLLHPVSARTHVGTFVTSVYGRGVGVLLTTIVRKELANIRIARSSVWSWLVPIEAAASAYLLRSRERRQSLLPRGSSRRIGAVAAIALAFIGLATSDSGPVFVALVFSFVTPLLLLLDLATDIEALDTASSTY
jgi:hypothetical protein